MKNWIQNIFGNKVDCLSPIRIVSDGTSQSFVTQERYDMLIISGKIDDNTRYNIIK